MISDLSRVDWILLTIAAAGIGFSKSGFPGVSLFNVVIFAQIFGAKLSTGILLPLLIVGDLCSVLFFGRNVQWKQLGRLLPPTMTGVLVGTLLMHYLQESAFKPIVGVLILVLAAMQIYRIWRPGSLQHIPHTKSFAWTLGLLAGVTTMLANAAGPIVALYLLAVALPKMQFVATSAWFFLTINCFKLPFSFVVLDLISSDTVWLNLLLAPAIPLGMLVGWWCVKRINQKIFDALLLAFTIVAALRMMY